MKTFSIASRPPSRAGFTLVELLVVIGIIAILAGVLLSAGGSAIRAAQRAKAANTATQIQTAAVNFYTEYSVYPVVGTVTTDFYISDGTGDKTNWGGMIEALCGNLSPSKPQSGTVTPTVTTNTRAIQFLQLKASDVDANDAPLNPLPYDKTNHPYFSMAEDSDYSGIVGDTGGALGNMPDFSASAQGNVQFLAKGATGGIAVWANCNTTTTTAKWNPGFIVHTY